MSKVKVSKYWSQNFSSYKADQEFQSYLNENHGLNF